MTTRSGATLSQQLALIRPSTTERGVRLFPCSVQLKNATVLDCVYIVEASDYQRLTGYASPEKLPAELRRYQWVSSGDLESIRESPARLPAIYANQLYAAGESGMGYMVFTVVFSLWCRRSYVQTFADFIEYPPGKGPADVKAVVPHRGNRETPAASAIEIYWCVPDDSNPEAAIRIPPAIELAPEKLDRARRYVLLRCILSFLAIAFLFVVCVANVPIHDGEYSGPIVPSHQGKVEALIWCIAFLIIVWIVDLGELENLSAQGDLDSGHIQKLFDKPTGGPEGDNSPPDGVR